MRLKALLIDDEINILRNLQLVLPWQEHDVEVIGTAKNGIQALELVRLHQPHLIFCDIRMPVMDGIDFLKELRQFDQDTEVIMLTGYQEFEYARTVLRHRVVDYVLKPIDYEALEELFIKVAGQIRESLQQLEQEDAARGRLSELAYEKMLLELIHDHTDQDKLMQWDKQFHIVDQQCLLFVMYGYDKQLTSSMYTVIESVFRRIEEGLRLYELHVKEKFLTIVAVGSLKKVDHRLLQECLLQLFDMLKPQAAELSIVAYNTPIGVTELRTGWQQLSKELSLEQIPCRLLPFVCTDSEQLQDRSIWQDVDKLIHTLKQMNRNEAKQQVAVLEESLRCLSSHSLSQVEMLMNAVLIYLIKELRRYDAVHEAYEQEYMNQLQGQTSIKEMFAMLRELVEHTYQERSNKRPQASIQAAKEYIEAHLSSDIAAEEVANYLNISNSYFSTLFKQHYGMNFIDYVTEARIERAKALLTLSSRSISDIAKTVGYLDRRYFNKVFLKKVGILPSVFREEYKNETG